MNYGPISLINRVNLMLKVALFLQNGFLGHNGRTITFEKIKAKNKDKSSMFCCYSTNFPQSKAYRNDKDVMDQRVVGTGD